MDPRQIDKAVALLKERKFEQAVEHIAGTNNRSKVMAVKRAFYVSLHDEVFDDERLNDDLYDWLEGRHVREST